MPDHLFALSIAIEIIVVVFEIAVLATVVRHFYRQHRAEGHSRIEAYVRAEIDEMKASGIPANLAERLGAVMRWELGLYRRIGGQLSRAISRLPRNH